MAFWTILTQDGPQYLVHILFLLDHHSELSHSETTVIISLIVGTIAICISIFNAIMCAPNEFDPILLQMELKRRQEIKTKMQREKEQMKGEIMQ